LDRRRDAPELGSHLSKENSMPLHHVVAVPVAIVHHAVVRWPVVLPIVAVGLYLYVRFNRERAVVNARVAHAARRAAELNPTVRAAIGEALTTSVVAPGRRG
jgi:hypothetical protein